MSHTVDELRAIASAAADLGDRYAAAQDTDFKWFSEKVDQCAALPGDEALDTLRELIEDAEASKGVGYGPPQQEINRARRRWLALYEERYGRAA